MSWRRAPGLRVVFGFGPNRLIRIFAVLVAVQAVPIALLLWRPDLLHPGDIGTDASNYYAAALRLINHSPLYALFPGDRPVPADNPPLWSVPLLSPPPIAVLWVPLAALLPGAVAMYSWWLLGLVGTVATAIVATLRRDTWAAIAIVVLAPAFAITAISGNVNALIVPAVAVVFLLEDRPQRPAVTCVIALLAAAAAATKLGPVLLLWWLVTRRRFRAAALALVMVGLCLAASVAVAGSQPFVDYLAISRATASSGVTPLSATGVLETLGLTPEVASLGPIACLVVAAVAALTLRNHRTLGAVAVSLGIVYATPVVRVESFAVLMAALAATLPRIEIATPAFERTNRVRFSGLALALAAALGIGAWIASSPTSSVTLENASRQPVIVRFGALAQDATFGFRVDPGSRVTAFGPLPGALTGSLVVYDLQCERIASVQAPPHGGHVLIGADGALDLSHPPMRDESEVARFDATCAGR